MELTGIRNAELLSVGEACKVNILTERDNFRQAIALHTQQMGPRFLPKRYPPAGTKLCTEENSRNNNNNNNNKEDFYSAHLPQKVGAQGALQ